MFFAPIVSYMVVFISYACVKNLLTSFHRAHFKVNNTQLIIFLGFMNVLNHCALIENCLVRFKMKCSLKQKKKCFQLSFVVVACSNF